MPAVVDDAIIVKATIPRLIILVVEYVGVSEMYFCVLVALSGVVAIAKMCLFVIVVERVENTTDKQVMWFEEHYSMAKSKMSKKYWKQRVFVHILNGRIGVSRESVS